MCLGVRLFVFLSFTFVGVFFSSTCLSFIILVIVTWDREGKMVEIRILAEGGKGGDNGGKGPREKEGEERK